MNTIQSSIVNDPAAYIEWNRVEKESFAEKNANKTLRNESLIASNMIDVNDFISTSSYMEEKRLASYKHNIGNQIDYKIANAEELNKNEKDFLSNSNKDRYRNYLAYNDRMKEFENTLNKSNSKADADDMLAERMGKYADAAKLVKGSDKFTGQKKLDLLTGLLTEAIYDQKAYANYAKKAGSQQSKSDEERPEDDTILSGNSVTKVVTSKKVTKADFVKVNEEISPFIEKYRGVGANLNILKAAKKMENNMAGTAGSISDEEMEVTGADFLMNDMTSKRYSTGSQQVVF